jgi:hypothetical protein
VLNGPVVLSIDRSFDMFRETAARWGFESIDEPTAGNRTSRVERDGHTLRLVWNEASSALTLQITHGLADAPPSGWHDLFEARCPEGCVGDDPFSGISLPSTIEYGFELMTGTFSSDSQA